MQSLAEFPQGIPIPVEEIRAALESVAIPGYTGSIHVEILLGADAAKCVSFAVIRRQTQKIDGENKPERQVLPDPERKKPVQKVIDDIRGKLVIRPVLTAFEVNIFKGVLQNITLQE